MQELYNYCTDYVINVANFTNTSYYEVNAFLFCFLYPFVLVTIFILYFIQKRRLNKMLKNYDQK